MLSGNLTKAIDNRSLADEPPPKKKTRRRMTLSKSRGRMGSLWWVCIHAVSGRDVSLSGFYLCQLTHWLQNCFVASLLNTNALKHTHKLNCAGSWCHSTSCITLTASDYQLLTLDPFTVSEGIDGSLFSNSKHLTFPLLLQSCDHVGFTGGSDSQMWSALFAF